MHSKTMSDHFKRGDKVNTPDGVGTIQQQDSCHYSKPDPTIVWLDRWGVKHDVYPEKYAKNSFTNDTLYYPTDHIQKVESNE